MNAVATSRIRIRVAAITITRAEGRTEECGKPITVSTWREANDVLSLWGITAPTEGGYDKCDFKVTWANGETHVGRYDLTGDETPNLAAHVRNFYGFMTLRLIPPRYNTPDQIARFRRYVTEAHTAEERDGMAERLDTYDLGEER